MIFRFRNEVSTIAQEIVGRSGGKLVLVANYEIIWFDLTADIADKVIVVMRARGSKQVDSQDESSSTNSGREGDSK